MSTRYCLCCRKAMPPDDVVWLLQEGDDRAWGPYHAKCAQLTALSYEVRAGAARTRPRELQPELSLDAATGDVDRGLIE